MIAQFTLTPLGTKSDSLSKVLAKAMKHVAESGLEYKVGPMGTVVQGDWHEVMTLINHCRKTILREVPRVAIQIAVDDRPGAKNPIKSKVQSLEKKMRLSLNK